MEIKYGLISCDSHAQVDKDAFTSRMSKAKWGDAIPQLVETDDKAHMAVPFDQTVQRWFVNGTIVGNRGAANCPTVMNDPMRKSFPQRWEEVPKPVYDPQARLAHLDQDGIDAEVLFPNDPVQSAAFLQGDAEFELDCVRAYNDAIAEWGEASDRYIPLGLIPYMSDINVVLDEVKRAVKKGHKGFTMLVEPSQSKPGLPHFNAPHWNPLWALCEDMDVPIHWHASAGLKLNMPRWSGFTRNEEQAMGPSGSFVSVAQFIPNLIFSGVLERYPRLQWVCAETGLGWVNCILEACDHEWEKRHLWTEGITTRPSEQFQRQVYVDFWYEEAGIEHRHSIGINNIMWESDYPHSTSTFPESWKFVDRTMKDVPKEDQEKLLYRNAMRLYKLQ